MLVKETTIEEAIKVDIQIPEFAPHYSKDYFEEVINNSNHIILVTYLNNEPISYLIAYDRDYDESLFIWLVGVIPSQRKKGALHLMMSYAQTWAEERGFKRFRVKTRNYNQAMRVYLVTQGYLFTDIEQYPQIEDHRITYEKDITRALEA